MLELSYRIQCVTGGLVGNTVGGLGDFVDMEVSVLVVTGVSGSGVGC